METKTTEQV